MTLKMSPLHVHTTYGSILDSIILPKELANKAALMGCPACAITDHGSMAATVMFYKACKLISLYPL